MQFARAQEIFRAPLHIGRTAYTEDNPNHITAVRQEAERRPEPAAQRRPWPPCALRGRSHAVGTKSKGAL